MTQLKPTLYYALFTGWGNPIPGILMRVTSETAPAVETHRRGTRKARVNGQIIRWIDGKLQYGESYSRLQNNMICKIDTLDLFNTFVNEMISLHTAHKAKTVDLNKTQQLLMEAEQVVSNQLNQANIRLSDKQSTWMKNALGAEIPQHWRYR